MLVSIQVSVAQNKRVRVYVGRGFLTLDKIYGVPRPRTFFNLNNALQWLGLIFL